MTPTKAILGDYLRSNPERYPLGRKVSLNHFRKLNAKGKFGFIPLKDKTLRNRVAELVDAGVLLRRGDPGDAKYRIGPGIHKEPDTPAWME